MSTYHHYGPPHDPYGPRDRSCSTHITVARRNVGSHAAAQSEFLDVLVCTRAFLWSLPFTTPKFEFRLQYYDFMITREPGVDE